MDVEQEAEYEADWDAEVDRLKDRPAEPTQEEKRLAAQVLTHSWMRWAFERAHKDEVGWEKAARHPTGDRVPEEWKSSHEVIPAMGASPGRKARDAVIAQSSKRR